MSGDPAIAAVSFDAVNAGRARGADVVIADTAGRLPTQLHLMEELKKIKRVITKAQEGAPHEVLLVVDGNPLRKLELLAGQGEHLSVIMKAGRFHKNRLAA